MCADQRRQILELGVLGKVPTDTLFELYINTNNGDELTFCQTRCQASIGGWVYEAAACLAKYIDGDEFVARFCQHLSPSSTSQRRKLLVNKRVVELGAGTGVVGIMTAYLGATTFVTDFESLVPLMTYNIDRNQTLISAGGGLVTALPLCWGTTSLPNADVIAPDFIILANCIYYESSLEPLLETILNLTANATSTTVILACYEERTKGICDLISRWHSLIQRYYSIEDIPSDQYDQRFKQDYVRLVIMTPQSS